MGKLFVVPTPVGNLEDMTFRAIRVLKEADLILAEDTRTSGILLKHFEIKNAMQSHHKFNEHKTVESVVNRIKAGETVALISYAVFCLKKETVFPEQQFKLKEAVLYAVLVVLVLRFKKAHPLLWIVLGAIAGLLFALPS